MKSPIKMLSGMILISFCLSGCDLFDKVDDVTFEGVLPLEFVINEPATSEIAVTYTDTKILNALENDEINKYKSKLKEIKLTGISYEIEGYDAPVDVTFSDGLLQVGSNQKTLVAVPSIALENTPETDLSSLNLDGVNEFARDLDGDQAVEIRMNGTLSSTPVAFRLLVKFRVSVTAEVLK